MKIDGNMVFIEKEDLNEKGEIIYAKEQERILAHQNMAEVSISNPDGYEVYHLIFDKVRDSLVKLSFPEKGRFAIYSQIAYYPKLEKVVFNNTNFYGILDYGFYHCPNLKEVVFPKDSKISYLCSHCFCYCDNLRELNFPKSLEKFGEGCFEHNVNLEQIIFKCKNLSMLDDKNLISDEKAAKKFDWLFNTPSLKEVSFKDGESAKKIFMYAVAKEPETFLLMDSQLFDDTEFVSQCYREMKRSLDNKFFCYFPNNEQLGNFTNSIVENVLDRKTKIEQNKIISDFTKFNIKDKKINAHYEDERCK